MKRKEVVLFMTVGTGINPDSNEAGYKKLAKKIYSTLNKIYPNYVIFFASNVSQHTIKYIEDLFELDGDEFNEGEDYEIVELNNIDDFNYCFESFEAKIWEYDYLNDKKYQIIMDYTSGTKTMSAAMACCGMLYSRDLISVGGDRSKGEVSVGTEIINYQNLYKIYDRMAIMRIRYNFNTNRFQPCLDVLNYIVDMNIHKDSLVDLCKGYFAWDTMDFPHAYEHLKSIDLNYKEFAEIKNELKKNLNALGIIVNSRSQNLKNCYILACIINNAIRRAEEYKFDDAIARLYRSFELIAQIKLEKYNLMSSDIDIDLLKEKGLRKEFIDELENMREDGKIRIGLIKDYHLLNELDDELGKYFMENESKIKDLTFKRNNSILAHGLDSQSKEDFDKFLELVIGLAKKLDKDMNKFLEETRFAKFDLKLDINNA